MKIRAAVLKSSARPLEVQELDSPNRRPEMLVRLSPAVSVTADLYTASGADPSAYSPTVLDTKVRRRRGRSATA